MLNLWTIAAVVSTVSGLGNLTVIGDSIASGYGLPGYVSGDDYSAPGSFGSILSGECEDYANFAVDGRKSGELLAALSGGEIVDSVAAADNIVISIGGNDFLKPMFNAVKTEAITNTAIIQAILDGTFKADMISDYTNRIMTAALSAAENVDTAAITDNIRQITERVHELNPDAKIVLLTVYNPFNGNVLLSAAGKVADDKLAELNGGIKALESDYVTIADIYTAFRGKEGQTTNINKLDIHPNSEGHTIIGEEVQKAILKSQ